MSSIAASFVPSSQTSVDYVEWEDAVTRLVEDRMEASRSDAQGIVEAQAKLLEEAWQRGDTPEQVVKAIWNL